MNKVLVAPVAYNENVKIKSVIEKFVHSPRCFLSLTI